MNFEQAYKRLAEISTEMDNKDLPLETAVSLYSEAAELIKICEKSIEEAKLQVEKIDNR